MFPGIEKRHNSSAQLVTTGKNVLVTGNRKKYSFPSQKVPFPDVWSLLAIWTNIISLKDNIPFTQSCNAEARKPQHVHFPYIKPEPLDSNIAHSVTLSTYLLIFLCICLRCLSFLFICLSPSLLFCFPGVSWTSSPGLSLNSWNSKKSSSEGPYVSVKNWILGLPYLGSFLIFWSSLRVSLTKLRS